MDTDIQAVLERAIPAAPPAVDDLEPLLRRGQSALRRRYLVRVVAVAAATSAAVVVGVTALGHTGGSLEPAPLATVSPSPTPSTPADVVSTPPPWQGMPGAPISIDDPPHDVDLGAPDNLAAYGALSGKLYILSGVQVLRWIDNPYRIRAPGRSDALVLEYAGTSYYYVITYEPDRSGHGVVTRASSQHRSFPAWVRSMRGITPSGVKDPDQLNLRDAGGEG